MPNIAPEHRQNRLIPADAIGEWLNSLDVSDVTKKSYQNGLRAFEDFLVEENLDLDNLQESDVIAFKKALLIGRSPGTVSTYLIGIRSFYRWASNESFPDIAAHVKGEPMSRNFKKDILTPEQAKCLLEEANGESKLEKRNYAILNLMLRTGLRDIEMARADIGDIRTEAGVMVLYIHGKGHSSKDDFVLLTDEAYKPIRRYLKERPNAEDDEPLFLSVSNRNKNGRLTTRSISGIAKKAMRAIGLNDKRYTAHSLRHTAVTFALLGGASLEETQEMARHASITTTMVYSHHINRIQNAAEYKINNILNV